MKAISYTCSAVLLALITFGCSGARPTGTYASRRHPHGGTEILVHALSTIRDSKASEQEVNRAFEKLTEFTILETAEFWVNIINDRNASEKHRRRCLYELFRRHFSSTVPLRKLRDLRGVDKWFDETNMIQSTAAKALPVQRHSGESVFMYQPDYLEKVHAGIFLRLSRSISHVTLLLILRGEISDMGIKILETKVSE